MYKEANVLGIKLAVSNLDDISKASITMVRKRQNGYICIANVHMVVTAFQNGSLNKILDNAQFNTSDGMPLVWNLRSQGYKSAQRVYGPDLLLRICGMAEENPIYFYGGSEETIANLEKNLSEIFPGLNTAGFESPPNLPEQPDIDMEVVRRINGSGARIVFVGLGCPKQEFWMAAHSPHITAVLIGVGAAFDFIAGTKRQAPGWMQRSGLEWLFRLVTEPKRLWKRYLVTNTTFLVLLAKHRLMCLFTPKEPH